MIANNANKGAETSPLPYSPKGGTSTRSCIQVKGTRASPENPYTTPSPLPGSSQSATKMPDEIACSNETNPCLTKMRSVQQSQQHISQTEQSSTNTEIVKIEQQLKNIKAAIHSIKEYKEENELDLELATIELNLTQRSLSDGIACLDYALLDELKVKLDVDLADVQFIRECINSSKIAQASLEKREQNLKDQLTRHTQSDVDIVDKKDIKNSSNDLNL